MGNIDSNLLIDQEWTGTFFPPGRADLSFAGRLNYSPINGLRLEFARPADMASHNLKWNYLLGYTSSGEPLTLVGEFGAEGNGINIKYGMAYWASTGYPFHYAIFGYHFDDTTEFNSFGFDISGVQDFFAADGMRDRIPFSKTSIVDAHFSAGDLNVIHSGKFDFVGDDLRVHFHSDDVEAVDELQMAYRGVCDRHPDFKPYLKRSLDYTFRFLPKSDLSIPDAYRIVSSVADLFAMLSFEPAKVSRFCATARDDDGKSHAMVVFPWRIDNEATIERSQTKRKYNALPLNNGDVELGLLLANWLDQRDRYIAISSLLQSKVSVVSEHEIHGNIVLAATQLEGIAVQARAKGKKEKYEYGLRNYASDKLRKHLAGLLNCTENNIGEHISDLRNDIAHIGRPKKLLQIIGPRKQFLVSIALQAVVIGYALNEIGVTPRAREKYQEVLMSLN